MDADTYFARLEGQPADIAGTLRSKICATGFVSEAFKWGHPIYAADTVPICLVKAAKNHVLLGFWDGRDLLGIEPRLVPSGGANMASMKICSRAEAESLPMADLIRAACSSREETKR